MNKKDFLKLKISKILSSGPNMAHSLSLLLMWQREFVRFCAFFFVQQRKRMHLRTHCETQPKQYHLTSKLPCFLVRQ